MSYAEFPHTVYGEKDHNELINLYQKLVNDYDRLCREIESLSSRLDEWENNGNSIITSEVNKAKQEVITSLNTKIDHDLAVMQNNYNASLTQLEQKMDHEIYVINDTLNTALAAMRTKIDDDIAAKFAALDSFVENTVQQYTTDMLTIINNTTVTLKEYVDSSAAELSDRIDKLEEESSDAGFSYLWDHVYSVDGMSCYDWYSYPELTCAAWNCIDLSCSEFYVNGAKLTGFLYESGKMFSPISGKKESIYDIVSSLIAELKICSLQAKDYDAMCITAEKFDNLCRLASKYDWRGLHDK